jgi:hypothetical protein
MTSCEPLQLSLMTLIRKWSDAKVFTSPMYLRSFHRTVLQKCDGPRQEVIGGPLRYQCPLRPLKEFRKKEFKFVPGPFHAMAPTKSTRGKDVLNSNKLTQVKAPATARPSKRSSIKHHREASLLVEGGGLPGVQKLKNALRQTKRLLAKVPGLISVDHEHFLQINVGTFVSLRQVS